MNNRHSSREGNYYSCLLEHESQTPNIIFRKHVDPVASVLLGISRCIFLSDFYICLYELSNLLLNFTDLFTNPLKKKQNLRNHKANQTYKLLDKGVY